MAQVNGPLSRNSTPRPHSTRCLVRVSLLTLSKYLYTTQRAQRPSARWLVPHRQPQPILNLHRHHHPPIHRSKAATHRKYTPPRRAAYTESNSTSVSTESITTENALTLAGSGIGYATRLSWLAGVRALLFGRMELSYNTRNPTALLAGTGFAVPAMSQ